MKKSLLEIYGLAVCFFAAATLVVISGQAAWDVVRFSAPELTLNANDWRRHQNDEAFAESLKERCGNKEQTSDMPSGTELTQKREKSFIQELVEQRRNALQSLVQNILIILVAAFAFFAHWRIATRARTNNS